MTAADHGHSADHAEISRATATFFDAFTSGPGCDGRLDRLPELFLSQAVIVRTCGPPPIVYGVEEFIAPRRALLTGGALTGFREWEVAERTDVFGDIAQRFSSYQKTGVQDGAAFTTSGMKTLQFVRSAGVWLISAAAWDDERDGIVAKDPGGS